MTSTVQKDFLRSAQVRARENIAPSFLEKYPLLGRALDHQYRHAVDISDEIYRQGQNRILEILDTHVPGKDAKDKHELMVAAILQSGCPQNMRAFSLGRKFGERVMRTVTNAASDPECFANSVRIQAAERIWAWEMLTADILLKGDHDIAVGFCANLGADLTKLEKSYFRQNLQSPELRQLMKETERILFTVAIASNGEKPLRPRILRN